MARSALQQIGAYLRHKSDTIKTLEETKTFVDKDLIPYFKSYKVVLRSECNYANYSEFIVIFKPKEIENSRYTKFAVRFHYENSRVLLIQTKFISINQLIKSSDRVKLLLMNNFPDVEVSLLAVISINLADKISLSDEEIISLTSFLINSFNREVV